MACLEALLCTFHIHAFHGLPVGTLSKHSTGRRGHTALYKHGTTARGIKELTSQPLSKLSAQTEAQAGPSAFLPLQNVKLSLRISN